MAGPPSAAGAAAWPGRDGRPYAGSAAAVLGSALYGLAAATVELLATLAAHGAAAELRAVGFDGVGDAARDGAAAAGKTGGHRWVKEIAVGVGGSDGAGAGRGVEMLEACWTVARDIDGVQGGRRGERGGEVGSRIRREIAIETNTPAEADGYMLRRWTQAGKEETYRVYVLVGGG